MAFNENTINECVQRYHADLAFQDRIHQVISHMEKDKPWPLDNNELYCIATAASLAITLMEDTRTCSLDWPCRNE